MRVWWRRRDEDFAREVEAHLQLEARQQQQIGAVERQRQAGPCVHEVRVLRVQRQRLHLHVVGTDRSCQGRQVGHGGHDLEIGPGQGRREQQEPCRQPGPDPLQFHHRVSLRTCAHRARR